MAIKWCKCFIGGSDQWAYTPRYGAEGCGDKNCVVVAESDVPDAIFKALGITRSNAPAVPVTNTGSPTDVTGPGYNLGTAAVKKLIPGLQNVTDFLNWLQKHVLNADALKGTGLLVVAGVGLVLGIIVVAFAGKGKSEITLVRTVGPRAVRTATTAAKKAAA
jgi:hypothetical protein